MPSRSEYKYLLVFVHTFTGWGETFPTWSETAMDVCKSLLKGVIPWFGLPMSIQSNNGPSLIAKIRQGLTTALGIDYKWHFSWHRLSSGKVDKMNHTLKKTLAKLCHETHEPGPTCVLLVLHRVCVAPRSGLRLSPLERPMGGLLLLLTIYRMRKWARRRDILT